MKVSILSMVVIFLVGCSSFNAPKAPEYGDFKYKKRVSVNQTVPIEVKVRN